MKRLFNKSLMIFLSLVMVLSSITVVPMTVLAADPVVVYSEDFEGTFTLETNEANNIKELKKGDNTVLTFVKGGTATFDETFPQTAEALVAVDGGTNTPVNSTKAVYTTGYSLNKNTEMYFNFPQVYNRGIVTVEFRVRRTNSSTTNYYTFYSDNINGYSPATDKTYKFEYFVNSSSKSRFRGVEHYVDAVTKSSDSYHDTTSAKGWPWLRLEFDLGNQTVTTSYKTSATGSYTTVGSAKPLYANGGGTETDPYYTTASVGALSVSGNGFATMDDLTITYTDSENAPAVSGVKFDGAMTVGTTLVADYVYNDTEGDKESGSVVTWRRCPDDEFTTYVQEIKAEPIESETALYYEITEEDVGYYIAVAVAPKNNAEVNPNGIEQEYRSTEPARYPQTVPMVTIQNPVEGQYVPAGETVNIAADAKCDNTTITNVDFYLNDSVVATVESAPYEYAYQFNDAGKYTMYAKAYNALGESASSDVANFSVTPVTDLKACLNGVAEEITTSIFGADTVNVKATVNNTSDDSVYINSFVALYDEDENLLAVATSAVTEIKSGDQGDVTAELEVNKDLYATVTYVKAFAWDSDTLQPYTLPAIYEIKPNTSDLSDLDIYLILGQSNASGRAGIASDCKATLDNVYLMNRSYEWEGAKNPFNRYNNIGEESYKYSNKMNFGYPFAKMLSQYVPGQKIGIINNAVGGTNLGQWEKGGTKDYYEKTMLMVKEALKYGEIKGILWHLGSSDMGRGYTRDEYITKLNNFANSFREDIGDMTIPFIVGELAPTSDERIEFNKVFMSIAEGDIHVDYSACVSAEGVVTSDGSHFTSNECKLMGRRYADEILKMNYGIDVPDDIVDNISYASTYENLALKGTASASSTNSSSTYNISYINDGSTETGWVSGGTADDGVMEYCIVDLGDAYTIEEIQLCSRTNYNNEADRKNLKILVSNDPTFTDYKVFGTRGTIAYAYKGTHEWFSVDTTKYRYVKVIKTVDEGLGLSEVCVYGY